MRTARRRAPHCCNRRPRIVSERIDDVLARASGEYRPIAGDDHGVDPRRAPYQSLVFRRARATSRTRRASWNRCASTRLVSGARRRTDPSRCISTWLRDGARSSHRSEEVPVEQLSPGATRPIPVQSIRNGLAARSNPRVVVPQRGSSALRAMVTDSLPHRDTGV